MDVLCIGHASWDITLLLDEFPRVDAKYEARELHQCGGGPAANAAFLLGKWGLETAFAGIVGDDHYGWRIGQELVDAGVDTSMLEFRAGHATPVSTILVTPPNGSRTIITRKVSTRPLEWPRNPAANSRSRAAVGASAPPESPRVLLFDGHEPSASLAALLAYPDAVSILDAGSWREGTAELAGRVDYLAASARFAIQATGLEPLEIEETQRACVAELRSRYKTWIIVTLGARGLVYDTGDGFHVLPAFPAEALDTTAAGDIFHGALAYGIATGQPVEQTLRLASMAASLSVRKLGGRTSVPTLLQVEQALEGI